MQKPGDRRLRDRHLLGGQHRPEFSQRDVRLLRHQVPDEFLVRRQRISLIPTKFGRTDATRLAAEPPEAYHRADAHSEPLRNFRDRRAILPCTNYAFTQIL